MNYLKLIAMPHFHNFVRNRNVFLILLFYSQMFELAYLLTYFFIEKR